MINLTRDDLIAIAPRPKQGPRQQVWDAYVKALTSATAAALFTRYSVVTPLRMQHALATMVAETNLSILQESGAYDAGDIVRVFGPGKHSAAIGEAEARRIAALPLTKRTEALFERAYGSGNPGMAKKLGNVLPGDGWRFRGALLNQVTGREAHERTAAEIGCRVEDLVQPIHAVHAFLIEWDKKNCNAYADKDDAVSIRKLINAGTTKVSVAKINGLPQAMAALKRAKAVIDDGDFSDAAPALAGSEHKPDTLPSSTEMQASAFTGLAGGYSTQDALAGAAARTAAGGEFSWQAFLLNLAADPQFWLGAVLIGTGVYLALKRRARFYIYGV